MDFNATIDLIIKDLDEARKIIDDLKSYPGVPAIQVELAKSKCKSAGEIIALLKDLNISTLKTSEDMSVLQVQNPSSMQTEKASSKGTIKSPLQSEKKSAKNSDQIIYRQEDAVPAGLKSETQASEHLSEEGSKHKDEKRSESKIVADKFSLQSSSFNEQLGNLKTDSDVSDILKTKPLTNLTEAIGLNDKFQYITEIFHGDAEEYDKVISSLNNVDNLADARAILISYMASENNNEIVGQLLDLVKRKLASYE